jgi:hypothetical protein
VEPVGVIAVPAPPPGQSTFTEKRARLPTKAILNRDVTMSVERKQDGHVSESTKAERFPVAELCVTNDWLPVEANPLFGSGNHETGAEVEVGKEGVGTNTQVRHI